MPILAAVIDEFQQSAYLQSFGLHKKDLNEVQECGLDSERAPSGRQEEQQL